MLTAFEKNTKKLIFASKGVSAICPDCGKELIPKCGKINTHHFSHPSKEVCKYYYHDSKSEWHYNWQLQINNPTPGVNIEVVIKSEERSKRADVITKEGIVIEFQKSPLPIEEKFLRERQYGNIIWVIHKDIEYSKSWKNSKHIILIDDIRNDHLYSYSGRFEMGLAYTISKKCFTNMIMNGNVAHPKIFFDIMGSKQIIRFNNKRYNTIRNYKMLHGNNNVKKEIGYLFDFFNKESLFVSNKLFNGF